MEMVSEFKKTIRNDVFGDDLEAIIADKRYNYIADNYSSVLVKHKEEISVLSAVCQENMSIRRKTTAGMMVR